MVGTAEILSTFEHCPRQCFWMKRWEKRKLTALEMLDAGIRAAVTEKNRKDYGNVAGETVFGLGVDPGIDSHEYDLHSEVIHAASLCDIIATAVRKPSEPPWLIPETLSCWKPSCFLSPDGAYLRRVVCVTSWSDERHYSVCRSWATLGAVCNYSLPMQIAVIVLGPHRSGKYHSFWTHGLLHPRNKKLRFRKKNAQHEPFKDSWESVWREDHDEIETTAWLEEMLADGVLADLCFSVKIGVPEKSARQHMLDLMKRKLKAIEALKTLPDEQMTGCDWPKPCQFRNECHAGSEPRNGIFKMISS
jgi:hypothetical protein